MTEQIEVAARGVIKSDQGESTAIRRIRPDLSRRSSLSTVIAWPGRFDTKCFCTDSCGFQGARSPVIAHFPESGEIEGQAINCDFCRAKSRGGAGLTINAARHGGNPCNFYWDYAVSGCKTVDPADDERDNGFLYPPEGRLRWIGTCPSPPLEAGFASRLVFVAAAALPRAILRLN
jgi:hypothetical protein